MQRREECSVVTAFIPTNDFGVIFLDDGLLSPSKVKIPKRGKDKISGKSNLGCISFEEWPCPYWRKIPKRFDKPTKFPIVTVILFLILRPFPRKAPYFYREGERKQRKWGDENIFENAPKDTPTEYEEKGETARGR